MCLCKGTGGVQTLFSWGIGFMPCPDSNCTFDKEKSWNDLMSWSEKYFEECERLRRDSTA